MSSRARTGTRIAVAALVAAALVTQTGCSTADVPAAGDAGQGASNEGDREYVSFTAGNGLSSQYHVYPVTSPSPAGLLIWMHGDGAYEFTHPRDPYAMGGPHGVRGLAAAQGYHVVSARSPDRSGTVTWWEEGEANATYMADLIVHLQEQYDVDANDIVLAGFSGGAQFTTQYFLPEYSGMLHGGGSIVFGGGGVPETTRQRPWNEDLIGAFHMHWASGVGDTAENSDEDFDGIGEARAGEEYYRALGFATGHEWIEGARHELDGLFGDIVAAQLWQHGPRGGSGSVPAAQLPAAITDGEDWAVAVEPHEEFAYVTVNVPEGVAGTTRVRAEGGDGYWYADAMGPGEHTFQMGDPGTPLRDPLRPGTDHAFRVYTVADDGSGGEKLTERTAGTFTTTASD